MMNDNLPVQKQNFNTAIAKPRKPRKFLAQKHGSNLIATGGIVGVWSMVGLGAIIGEPLSMLLIAGGISTVVMSTIGISCAPQNQKPTTWTTPSGQKLQAPKWATTVYDQIQYSFYNLYQLDETLPKNRKKLEKLHQKAQDLEAYITVLDHKDQPDPDAKVEYLKKRPITTTQTIIESGSVMTSTGTTALQKPKKIKPFDI